MVKLLEVENTFVATEPVHNADNKVVITPKEVWYWPFRWENLDAFLEHYKVEEKLLKEGEVTHSDDFITGYMNEFGNLFLYDWRERPPDWLNKVLREYDHSLWNYNFYQFNDEIFELD